MNISRCNSQPQPRKASEESDESLTNEKAPSPTSKHWMAFHWRLRKIETNGFGGKCDAISSKNRGWLLTNERLCHLGQITQQINGKEKTYEKLVSALKNDASYRTHRSQNSQKGSKRKAFPGKPLKITFLVFTDAPDWPVVLELFCGYIGG